jgi:DNA primase catalytic core
MITERSIENVLNRVDIVDVVSRYVDLKRKGANYVACCPFHNERTPSFIVNPSRNTWHCFGSCQEGGNAIKFLMRQCNRSFPEAVRELGKMYGVTIEETDSKEQTAEQTANARKREAMIFAYEALQPFFVSQLSESSEEGRYAYSYATKRWSQDFVNECGIGYAPRNGILLVQFAQANNIPQDVLLDMGVLRTSERNGQLYSFFRERVMIPIRDRFGRIIGYTARYIGENEETAKYLNSTSSLLYSKENSIFGIHVALRSAAKENKFYLVEGAPDVLRLHLLGVNNTIASLGSAWTEKQFSQIKRFSQNLCFLPDADPPKPGEPYGTGISAVIKNALMALDMGFNITVKEIPLGKGNTKNDPDSFCRSKAILEDLEEEDFIIWYAKKLSVENGSQEQKSQMVMTISTLVAKIEDDVKQSMFIDMLVKTLPGRSLWKNAIRTAKKRLTEQKLKESNLSLDMIEQYGFQEQNHCYFSVGEDGKRRQWSNFTMKPLFHIKDNTMALRLYLLTNVNGVEVTVEMKQEELVSLTKFRQRVESQGNFIWKAKEEQLTTLKMYLYATTETAEQIVQLGWQQQGFFAFGNGIFTSEWHEVDELGIVRLGEQGNYYLPAFSSVYRNDTQFFQFERRFTHLGLNKIPLYDYSELLVEVFGDNAKVGIAFLLATLFRDVVVSYTRSFPILNLFGPKGSGKSELGHSLMAFFIIDNIPPNISNSTLPALADAVAQCSNALVHLDEFKNNIDIDKREFLKGLWDGTGRNRMNMERDKKREVTKVSCGVIVSGQEMATADIALFSRFIFLSYSKSQFSQEAKEKFAKMAAIRKLGCSHLVLEILQCRALFEAEFRGNYNEAFEDIINALGQSNIEDRIIRNWVIPLAALRTLQDALRLPFTYNDLLKVSIDGIIAQNGETLSNNELNIFWDIVSFLRQEGKIWLGGDYRIELENRIKCTNHKYEIEFPAAKKILYLRHTRIFQLYKMHGRYVNEALLPPASLQHYLENSDAYIGRKQSIRFKNIVNGVQTRIEVIEKGQVTTRPVTAVDQALVFDYDLLVNQFGLNLEEFAS